MKNLVSYAAPSLRRRALRTVMLLLFVVATPMAASAAVSATAEIVLLRQDCTVNGVELDDCFESAADLSDPATGWIWNTRQPTAASPLLVEVGPGTFGSFDCPDGGATQNGYVTVRGAGREQSIFQGGRHGVHAVNCTRLAFQSIGMHGTNYGVLWNGGGDATWTDVDMVAIGTSLGNFMGWADICSGSDRSVHYVFGSRSRAVDPGSGSFAFGYFSACAESWFYGGDIELSISSPDSAAIAQASAVRLATSGDLRVFGSTVRAIMTGYRPQGVLEAVRVDNELGAPGAPTATFHMHGGIINASVVASGASPVDAAGVRVGRGGFAHTPGTAHVVKPASGGVPIRTEIVDAFNTQVPPQYLNPQLGVLDAPFLWPAGATPPHAPGEANVLESLNGSDLFVETDCSAAGDCDAGGSEAHLMVYNPDFCTTEGWLDVVTGRCRNDTTP